MEKETTERIAPAREQKSLDDALQAVYAQYGSDLDRFFRDAYNEASQQALQLQKCVRPHVEINP